MKRKKLLLVVAVLIPVILLIGFMVLIAICQLTPITAIDQSVTSFVGKDTYTVDDIVLTVQDTIQQSAGYRGQAIATFTQASFVCQQRECQLKNGETTIYVEPHFGCPFDDNPYLRSVAEFFFNVTENRIHSESHQAGVSSRPIRWGDLPIGIDEAIDIAFDTIGDGFAQQHPQFVLGIAYMKDRWSVRFNSDLTDNKPSDIRIEIDYNNGSLINAD